MLVERFYVKLACGSFNSSWFYAIISAGLNLLGVDSWLIQYLFMVCYFFLGLLDVGKRLYSKLVGGLFKVNLCFYLGLVKSFL